MKLETRSVGLNWCKSFILRRKDREILPPLERVLQKESSEYFFQYSVGVRIWVVTVLLILVNTNGIWLVLGEGPRRLPIGVCPPIYYFDFKTNLPPSLSPDYDQSLMIQDNGNYNTGRLGTVIILQRLYVDTVLGYFIMKINFEGLLRRNDFLVRFRTCFLINTSS